MEQNKNSFIIEGANPSMVWCNIADYIKMLSKSMMKTYKQRQRNNEEITWDELDELNDKLRSDLDIIMCGNKNVQNENKTMNKKQTIRLNESQLKRIIKESVNRVLMESQYDGLSQDDWDNLYRYANDKVLSPDYHRFHWKIFKLKGINQGFDKFIEKSDRYAYYQSEEEALNDGLNHLKKYSEGTYYLSLSDVDSELRVIITHNGEIIRDEEVPHYHEYGEY